MHYVMAKGILSAGGNINLYRGCTHGCIYCDSRSRCYHIDHAFEDVEVKQNAVELLEDALRRRRAPCMVGTGSMTDPYLPLEAELRLTRRAMEVVERYGCGFTVITKSDLILRDLDLLSRIQQNAKCVVQMTLTTADETLCRKLEPNVCTTARRCEVLRELQKAGIPTVVWLSPILPFINDTEENISTLLDRCEEAGVWGILCFGMGLTLREGNREYFYQQLDRHFPGLKKRYIDTYGNQYVIDSPNSKQLLQLLRQKCRQHGIIQDNQQLFTYLSTFTNKQADRQQSLFE